MLFGNIKIVEYAGYPLELYFQIPCVFLIDCKFSVPIYVICDYNILHTQNLCSFNKILEVFAANIEMSFTFRIREFTT